VLTWFGQCAAAVAMLERNLLMLPMRIPLSLLSLETFDRIELSPSLPRAHLLLYA